MEAGSEIRTSRPEHQAPFYYSLNHQILVFYFEPQTPPLLSPSALYTFSCMDISKLESAIRESVIDRFHESPMTLLESAGELSDLFTKKRGKLSKNYLDNSKYRAAYILHFTLTNITKIHHCLNQLSKDLGDTSIKILDLGCGSGAGSLAASQFFKDVPLEITAIDRSEAILKDAACLFKSCGNEKHRFNTIHSEIHARSLAGVVGRGRFDIIIMANLLNEFRDSDEAFRLCKHLLEECLSDGGHVVIIDPALKETTRSLMTLRDHIIDKCDTHVMAPCLHQNKCPMLKENERDWGHFYIEWERPPLIEEMDNLVGTDHTYLKMGYLILKKNSNPKHVIPAEAGIQPILNLDPRFRGDDNQDFYRVISSPLISKGKKEFMLCGSDGVLRRVRRLDRHRSEANADMDCAKRGDIISCKSTESLSSDDQFQIRRTWK